MRRMMAMVCGLGVWLLLSACTATGPDPSTLREGYAKYAARQLDEAESIATRYISGSPNSPNVDEALYLRGLARLTKGDKSGAAEDFRQAIGKSSRADLKAKAFRGLGDIAFDGARWQDALDDYQAALSLGPHDTLSTHCSYRAGACLQALGEWSRATPFFREVAAVKDDPYLADRAIARMDAAHFSLQFGAFEQLVNAAELRDQLKGAGINAALENERREGKIMFLVRTGSYATLAQATAARDQYQPQYPLVTIVP